MNKQLDIIIGEGEYYTFRVKADTKEDAIMQAKQMYENKDDKMESVRVVKTTYLDRDKHDKLKALLNECFAHIEVDKIYGKQTRYNALIEVIERLSEVTDINLDLVIKSLEDYHLM